MTPFRYENKEADPYSSHSIILARIGEGRGKRLLDVGAAQGVITRRLTDKGFEVTAIEGDPKLAALLKDSCHETIETDLDRDLPELKGQFDVIVYGDILEHLKNSLAVLRGLNRYLRPTGTVIISVPNFVHLWVRLHVLMGHFEYAERGILDRSHLRFFTLKSFKNLLADAGLEIEDIVATPVPLSLAVPQRYHGWWLAAFHCLDAKLAQSWKTMFGYQFVAVARPKRTS